VVDGILGPVEHSWIELSSARGVAILDTYPRLYTIEEVAEILAAFASADRVRDPGSTG